MIAMTFSQYMTDGQEDISQFLSVRSDLLVGVFPNYWQYCTFSITRVL